MYLQNDRLVVRIGDNLVLDTHGESGTKFLLDETAVVGWDDGVDVKRNFTPRQIRSGDFLEHGHHAARYISFSGTVQASSIIELHELRDLFSGAVPPNEYKPLSVQNRVGTRYSTVSIAGKRSWVQHTDTSAAWKIDLYAPDPQIYGTPKTISLPGLTQNGGIKYPLAYELSFGNKKIQQSQLVENNGNIEAWPIFKVTGDFHTGFSIIDNLGGVIVYTGSVSMNAPVILDSLTGNASQNGSDRSTFLSSRKWFSIPPQQTLQPSFIPFEAANGWCDIIFRDTWV